MIPQFMRELASFVAAAILCALPFAEQRGLPPLHYDDGPAICAPHDNRFQIAAVVAPQAEFQLIKAFRPKRRKDSDAVRPAWGILGLLIFVFLYLFLYDKSHTFTGYILSATQM
jgi:hypothetical protein